MDICTFLLGCKTVIIRKEQDMTSTTITLKLTKTIITYDLSPCEISAEDICNKCSKLYTSISGENQGSFSLPNTTLSTTLNKKDAEKAFKEAVKKASSKEKITKLFVIDVSNKKVFIENN